MNRVLLALSFVVIMGGSAFALDCSTGNYVQGPGGYYSKVDRSGPYALGPSPNCNPYLMGTNLNPAIRRPIQHKGRK